MKLLSLSLFYIPAYQFQEQLLCTMMQIENVYFQLAAHSHTRDCLIICDRGTMDASACKSSLIIFENASKVGINLDVLIESVFKSVFLPILADSTQQ